MPRDLDDDLKAELPKRVIRPAILASLGFRSKTEYVWSGVGPLVWGGKTFQGVGSLGSVGTVSEGVEVKADGTSVTLSGIDVDLLGESMTDVRVGAPAKLWLAMLDQSMAIIGNPYCFFKGEMDPPKIVLNPPDDGGEQKESLSITIPLESRMLNMQRAGCRRYTQVDQRMTHPTDTAFRWVELYNDIALRWGH